LEIQFSTRKLHVELQYTNIFPWRESYFVHNSAQNVGREPKHEILELEQFIFGTQIEHT